MEKDKKPVRSFDLDKKPARSFDLDKNDEAEAMPASDTKVGVGKNTRFDFNKTEEPAATTQSQPVSAEKPEFASEKKTHLVLGKKAVTVPTNQPNLLKTIRQNRRLLKTRATITNLSLASGCGYCCWQCWRAVH